MGDIAPSTALEFTFPETSSTISTITIGGEPWFSAADVCQVLKIVNMRSAISRLSTDEKMDHGVDSNDTLINKYISESGLYRLVFTSRVDAAERFRIWVARDVIPSFRKTGGFQIPASFPEALRMAALAIEERDQAREIAATAMASATRAERQVQAISSSAGAWDALACPRGSWDAKNAIRVLRRDPALAGITTDQYRVAVFRVGIARWSDTRKVFHLSPNAVKAGLAAGSDTAVRITPKGLALVHENLGGSRAMELLKEDLDALVVEGELVDTDSRVVA